MSKSRSNPGKSATVVSVLALSVVILFLLAASVGGVGTIRVDWDAPGCKTTSGQPDPYSVVYCKINTAVKDATPGDTIHVYPGTYDESVDLKYMVPPVNISLVTVNDAGIPTPGTATVDATGVTHHGIHALGPLVSGTVTIDGFNVMSAGSYNAVIIYLNGDVTIRNVTASASGTLGSGIRVDPASGGTVTITNCVANSNAHVGILVQGSDFSGQDVNITNCTANNNGYAGIEVTSLDGNVYIANCTANGNGMGGISVFNRRYPSGGDVVIENCTANGNPGDYGGFRVGNASGALTITNCVARDNGQDGVYLIDLSGSADRRVKGSIICGNSRFGLWLPTDVGVNAKGNWWGCPDGPGGGGCNTIGGSYAANVSRDPWIDTITATVGPLLAGHPSVVDFRFYGYSDPDWVYLGEGPGDLHGTPPFTVTTTNGTLTDSDETGSAVHEFVLGASGVLSVTLVPASNGAATVTLDGPCGLDMVLPLEVETYWVYVPLVMRNY